MYYVPFKIPGYEDLVAKKTKHTKKVLICPKCNVRERFRLKSGKYDPF